MRPLNRSRAQKPTDFDDGQGDGEQQTEPYMEYGEGAAEPSTQPSAKRASKLLGFAQKETRSLRGVSIHAGFPNPAGESPLQNPDLNRLLIRHPAATYCMRITGHAWEERGIFNGDIAVIDRALNMRPKDLVIWWQEEGFVIGQLQSAPQRADIWGAVSAIIHQYHS